jgi:hypothetical protein
VVGGAAADFPAHVVRVMQGLPEVWPLQLVVVSFEIVGGEVDAAGLLGDI